MKITERIKINSPSYSSRNFKEWGTYLQWCFSNKKWDIIRPISWGKTEGRSRFVRTITYSISLNLIGFRSISFRLEHISEIVRQSFDIQETKVITDRIQAAYELGKKEAGVYNRTEEERDAYEKEVKKMLNTYTSDIYMLRRDEYEANMFMIKKK